MEIPLNRGENILISGDADLFHSNSGVLIYAPHIVVTDRSFQVLEKRGRRVKRLEKAGSWPLRDLTQRLNTAEGSIEGTYFFHITLFTKDDTTITTGFRTEDERDQFKLVLANAISPHID